MLFKTLFQNKFSNIKMQENQYKSIYDELQMIGSNPADESKLYLVRQHSSGNYRMAKKISIFQTSETSQDQTLNQVRILKDLSNPHVIQYFDVMLQNDEFITILQFCEEGDLEHYLKRRKDRKEHLSQKLILSWLMQLLMALEYIHSKNIIHRLVSTKNVYLNHQGDLKLGSFGRARTLSNTMQKAMTMVGSPCNLSPEAVQGHPYDQKLDIWALGCLIYELSTFNHPYKIKNLPQLYEMIVKNPPLELPVKYSKYLSPIYKKMMKKNPNLRPSAKQLLEEKIFLKLMKEYLKKKKIDALDLREITPKQLAIHRKKKEQQKSNKLTLPPLVPSPNTARKQQKQSNRLQKNIEKNREKSRQKGKKKQRKSNQKVKSEHKEQKLNLPQKHYQEIENKAKSSNNSPKQEKKQIEDDQLLYDSRVSNSQRITQPKFDQAQYISLLYQIKLELLQKRYSPQMSQIFQQTVEFDDQ